MKSTSTRRRAIYLLSALAPIALAAGCANFGYYLRSVDGQIRVLQARQPITDLLADPATPPALKARLELASRMRDFASRELKLPDNRSYRSYADLQRPFVVWNVFAAPEFAVEPKQWCFVFVGCVRYRGYFSREAAEQFAAELREQGFDVYTAGVPAYSTLGWFDDPVLNTFINYPEHELARLIFHELAHQLVYVRDDTEFNESFAAAVEAIGVERWITRSNDAALRHAFEDAQRRRAAFLALVQRFRERLAALYRLRVSPDEMRARKLQTFAEMQREHRELKAGWNGYSGYDRFFGDPNNAHLASVAIYSGLVPRFQALFQQEQHDLARFYQAVKDLARLPKDERAARLNPKTAVEPPMNADERR